MSEDVPFPFQALCKDHTSIKLIGGGKFGTVATAFSTVDSQTYAIKAIIFQSIRCSDEKLTHEAVLFAQLDHPNIVRYHTSWITPPCLPTEIATGQSPAGWSACSPVPTSEEAKRRILWIKMEFCGKGDLNEAIDSGLHQDRPRISKLFTGIVKGLIYLHDRGIAHGELHMGNILISNNGDAKIGDFGRAYASNATEVSEVLNLQRKDIKQLGHILLRMLIAPITTDKNLILKARRELLAEDISLPDVDPRLRNCLRSIWNGDEERIPKARELLNILQGSTSED